LPEEALNEFTVDVERFKHRSVFRMKMNPYKYTGGVEGDQRHCNK
jgi:hypothetical protein